LQIINKKQKKNLKFWLKIHPRDTRRVIEYSISNKKWRSGRDRARLLKIRLTLILWNKLKKNY
jgi:hypothetical protein